MTSLVPASPAPHSATPGKDVALPTNGTFFRIRSESSNKSSPDMSFLKMFPASYPQQELARWNQQDQSWEMPQLGLLGTRQQLSGSFARTGIAVDGMLYPLQTQAHRTSDKGGGVSPSEMWLTPRASETSENPETFNARNGDRGSHNYGSLSAQVKWLTPSASPSGFYAESDETTSNRPSSDNFLTLPRAVQQSWPTPVADDTGTRKKKYAQGGTPLSMKVQHWPTPSANEDAAGTPNGKMQKMLGNHPDVRSQAEGTLNPTWVSWLMGLPTGWESLESLDRNAYAIWFEEMRNGTWWDTERDLPRVVTGTTDRVKRLRALGNGIVPASLALFLMGVHDAIH